MIVRWTSEAERDRSDVMDHIAADNRKAAIIMDELFDEAARSLTSFPNRGRVSNFPSAREILPHANYRLIYKVDNQTMLILALIHAARQWPPVSD